ncbi:MAG: hypothetical protein Q8J88_00910 [Bacteroidales bacterium]|nr:hypothetical protein [Bacteroidales bacterium]
MDKVHYGLKSLKMGAVAVDGGMGTSLTDLGGTLEGSATLTMEDGEKGEITIEEADLPVHTWNTQGEMKIVFDIFDMSPANIARVFGGTVTGTGATETFNGPVTTPTIEQSLEIITKNNIKWSFPRVKVNAKLNINFTKKDVFKATVTCVVLQPTKAETAPFSYVTVS